MDGGRWSGADALRLSRSSRSESPPGRGGGSGDKKVRGGDSNEDATPKAGTKRLLASLYVTSFQTELKWLICCYYQRSSVVEMGNRNYTT